MTAVTAVAKPFMVPALPLTPRFAPKLKNKYFAVAGQAKMRRVNALVDFFL